MKKLAILLNAIGLSAAVASPLALADEAQLNLAPGAFDAEKTQYVQSEIRGDAQRVDDSFWYKSTGGVGGY